MTAGRDVAAHPIWARGFRPFFLGGALHALLAVPLWTAMWLGAWPAPRWLAPAGWHAHEMLFGLVAAAIAGFLLTAAPVWSGRPALCGPPLRALFAVWVAGRAAMLAEPWLPRIALAAVDVAFLPALVAVFAHTLRGSAQRRNHGIVAVVAALAVANAALHAAALGLWAVDPSRILRLAVDAVVVLIVVIGGRITPAFTVNALRRAGVPAEVTSRRGLDRAAVAAVVGVAAVDLVAPGQAVARAIALGAGLLVAARMAGWQTRQSLSDPLLWSLHAGLAWVVVGLLLVGLGAPGTSGLHALGAGAMGSMILAVMTRVSLGHTGRPLALPPGAVIGVVAVHAGAALRVAAAALPALQPWALPAAAALWAGGFGVFAAVYAPILLRPRVDGRPG